MLKRCTQCGIEQPLDEFHRAKEGRFGFRSACKACTKVYQTQPEVKDRARLCRTTKRVGIGLLNLDG